MPLSVSAAPGGAGDDVHPAPDDCFCCCHYVHPQVRYRVTPAYTFLAAVEAESAPRPQFTASQFYHPPLA